MSEIKEAFIAVGGTNPEKSLLWLNVSKKFIKILEEKQFIHIALEEAVRCASLEYYAAGILVYSQLCNCFGVEEPEARHKVAHHFLEHKPSKETYDEMLKKLKWEAKKAYLKEIGKFKGTKKEYFHELSLMHKKYTEEHLSWKYFPDVDLDTDMDTISITDTKKDGYFFRPVAIRYVLRNEQQTPL
jgi:hypothetical protein